MNPRNAYFKPILLAVLAWSLVSTTGCSAVSSRINYYRIMSRGEDRKVRAVVTNSLEAWGSGEFAESYGYMSQSYRMAHTMSEFLARRQRIDVLLGSPAISFAVTQVYIYPSDPNRAEALVLYKSADGKTARDIASLRHISSDRWEITDWWVKN